MQTRSFTATDTAFRRRQEETKRTVIATAATETAPEQDSTLDFPAAWLRVFRETVVAAGRHWSEPHVSEDASEVTFEWWSGPRNLTVFFRGYQVEVLRTWGVNIDTEMDTVEIVERQDLLELWDWLHGA